MKRLERAKLYVLDYAFDTRGPTYILADSFEDALSQHKRLFPSYHRNLQYIKFASPGPLFTDTVADREFFDAAISADKPEPQQEDEEE